MIIVSATFCPRAYMDRFVYRMALGVVLLHMTCGCCWHHVHSGETVGGHESSAMAARCGCEHHDHADSEQPGDRPLQGDRCDGQQCVFVRADSSQVLGPFFGQDWAMPVGVPVCRLTLGRLEALELPCRGLGPPLRLHLLNRTLLL